MLHHLAVAYSQRPSEIVGLTDELAAINFDLRILQLGREAERRNEKDTPSMPGRPGSPPGRWPKDLPMGNFSDLLRKQR